MRNYFFITFSLVIILTSCRAEDNIYTELSSSGGRYCELQMSDGTNMYLKLRSYQNNIDEFKAICNLTLIENNLTLNITINDQVITPESSRWRPSENFYRIGQCEIWRNNPTVDRTSAPADLSLSFSEEWGYPAENSKFTSSSTASKARDAVCDGLRQVLDNEFIANWDALAEALGQ